MKRWMPAAGALVALSLLPVAADAMRGNAGRCAFDGVSVDPAFRVTVGKTHEFCGVRCAQRWLERARGGDVRVTDCTTGAMLDAQDAWYLHTYAGWRDGAPDTIRVFSSRAAAQRHADAHGGELLTGAARPFARTERSKSLDRP